MKNLMICLALASFVACTIPSAEDIVRGLRRGYVLELEMLPSAARSEIVYEVTVTNNSGKKDLQELTLIARAFDASENEIWMKQFDMDVTGVGNHASETKAFRESFAQAGDITSYTIELAPDNEGSGYEKYTEFMRIR